MIYICVCVTKLWLKNDGKVKLHQMLISINREFHFLFSIAVNCACTCFDTSMLTIRFNLPTGMISWLITLHCSDKQQHLLKSQIAPLCWKERWWFIVISAILILSFHIGSKCFHIGSVFLPYTNDSLYCVVIAWLLIRGQIFLYKNITMLFF